MANFNWIGQTLGDRYAIEDILGKGGMSSVYKATDPNLKRVVAVKMIHPHLSDNPEFVVRFKEEAAAVAQLRHPNIVQVFDFDTDGDLYYMVLEFVPGETLQARLRRLNAANRRLSLTEILKFATNLSDAVAYAHQRGMIHRDIKPANVMLDIHGQAILMDFGIAKIVGGQSHTATGATVGTALYMSPEQIRGERIDERSDVYSIGVTLFEMVNGRPPYEADSAMTLMMMHLNDPVPDLRQIHPDTPDDLMAIIEKSLAKDRAERFSSAQEMATALREVRERLEDVAADATVVEAPTPPPPVTQSPSGISGASERQVAPAQPVAGATAGAPSADRAADRGGPPRRDDSVGASFLASLPAPAWIAAGVGGLAVLLLGVFMLGGLFGGGDGGPARPTEAATETTLAQNSDGDATRTAAAGEQDATAAAVALDAASPTATNTPAPTATQEPATATPTPRPSNTPTAQPTDTLAPTATPAPTQAPTATTAPTPAPTQVSGPYAQIDQITVQGNDYVVSYETLGFTESQDGWHTHFFFNTVPPEQAGVPGSGPWIVYYGPSPFTQYKVSDRPAGATQMCVRVANADHSLYQSPYSGINTGNCVNLP